MLRAKTPSKAAFIRPAAMMICGGGGFDFGFDFGFQTLHGTSRGRISETDAPSSAAVIIGSECSQAGVTNSNH